MRACSLIWHLTISRRTRPAIRINQLRDALTICLNIAAERFALRFERFQFGRRSNRQARKIWGADDAAMIGRGLDTLLCRSRRANAVIAVGGVLLRVGGHGQGCGKHEGGDQMFHGTVAPVKSYHN